jgi:hypothetical protein
MMTGVRVVPGTGRVSQAVGAPRPTQHRWRFDPVGVPSASRAVAPLEETLTAPAAGASHSIHPQRGLIMRGRRR